MLAENKKRGTPVFCTSHFAKISVRRDNMIEIAIGARQILLLVKELAARRQHSP